jgi:hypothetical protein
MTCTPTDESRKKKKECCEKPPHKRCKGCPKR